VWAWQAHWVSAPHQLSISLLWWVNKEDCVMLQAASSLCQWSAGATVFLWMVLHLVEMPNVREDV